MINLRLQPPESQPQTMIFSTQSPSYTRDVRLVRHRHNWYISQHQSTTTTALYNKHHQAQYTMRNNFIYRMSFLSFMDYALFTNMVCD